MGNTQKTNLSNHLISKGGITKQPKQISAHSFTVREMIKKTQFLASLGGKDLSKQTRNVMRLVAKNPVWSRFSLKGRKKKEALEKLHIWRPILNALLKGKGCPSQSDVKFQVSDFLKYAPHQQGGLLHKKVNIAAMEENPVPE